MGPRNEESNYIDFGCAFQILMEKSIHLNNRGFDCVLTILAIEDLHMGCFLLKIFKCCFFCADKIHLFARTWHISV